LTLDAVVFGAMFVVALGSSMAMLFARNAVHVALFLVAAQVALALAFLLQGAFFVAAIQIIIYAGAIMVLFLFVIMLLGVASRESLIEPLAGQRPLAIGLALLLAAQIIFMVDSGVDLIAAAGAEGQAALEALNRDPGNVVGLANTLFSTYMLPFQVTAALLVAAIVGVMVLSRRIQALSVAPLSERASEEAEAEA
jgi:NADH-quinone oxidoreductase subunit J